MYNLLIQAVQKVPKYDIVIVIGDFNAKMGKEAFIRSVAGKFSLHEETSEN